MKKISKKFCLIGTGIQHSLSPLIHSYIFERDSIDAAYELVDLPSEKFNKKTLDTLIEKFSGINVTSPFKTSVAKMLGENLDQIARIIGSVNTICINADSSASGFNTDLAGLKQGVFEIIQAQMLFPPKLVVLGGGGVARSVIFAFIEHCVRYHSASVPEVTVIMRDPGKNEGIVSMLAGIQMNKFRIRLSFKTWSSENIRSAIKCGGIIVNATPAGSLSSNEKTPFDFYTHFSKAGKGIIAVDLVYNPSETEFLKTAGISGAWAINGLGMLVYQALGSLELWLDKRISEKGIFQKLSENGYDWIR